MSLWADINKQEEDKKKKQQEQKAAPASSDKTPSFWETAADIGSKILPAVIPGVAPLAAIGSVVADPKKAKDTAKQVVDAVTSAPSLIGRGLGEAVPGGGIDSNQAAVDESQSAFNQMQALYKAGKITKEKWTKYLTDSAKQDEGTRKNIDASVENTDPLKQGAAVAQTGLDVITAGRGSGVVKGGEAALEGGLKIAPKGASRVGQSIKDLLTGAPVGVKGVATEGAQVGGLYGAAAQVQDKGAEVQPTDLIQGAETGAIGGSVLGGLLAKLTGKAPTALADPRDTRAAQAAASDIVPNAPAKAQNAPTSALETPEETFRKAMGIDSKTMNADAASSSIVAKPESSLGGNLNKTMNADVTTGAPVEVAVDGAPGLAEKPAPSRDLGLSINQKVQEDLGLNKLDSGVISKTSQFDSRGGKTAAVNKSLAKYTDDPIGYASKTLGNPGAETAKAAVAASKVKSDMMNEVRDSLGSIDKETKQLAGKTSIARTELSKRISDALEHRDQVGTIITDPKERALYDKTAAVFDFFKGKMQESGIPVRENYSPHNMIKDLNQPSEELKNSITNRTIDPTSRYTKERKDENMDARDFDILGGIYNYANSVSTDIAYSPVIKAMHENLDKVPAALRANKSQYNDGSKYLQRMLDRAISPESKSASDRVIQKLQGTAYKNILAYNPKNALFAGAQRTLAKSDVSGEAKTLNKAVPKETWKKLEENNSFSGYTLSGDTLDDPASKVPKSNIGKLFNKLDWNRASEEASVAEPYRLGFAQGVSETQPYKDAIKAGKKPTEAFHEAIKDEEVVKYGSDLGNIQVNSTAFGANAEARPEVLKGSVPKKALTMFMRFPLGMTNYIRNTIQIKDARVWDVLQKGDPRAVPVADMRNHYKVIQEGLEQAQKASKSGKFKDIPQETLNDQVKLVKENIKTIDNSIKDLSQLRGGKRTAALARMWAATAAVQFAFDGVTSAINPDKSKPTVEGSLAKTDPTIVSSLNPANQNSKVVGGLNSPTNPFGIYGFKSRAALNLVPGAGIANRITGGAISNFLDDKIKGK